MKKLASLYDLQKEDPDLAKYWRERMLEAGIHETELDIPFIDNCKLSIYVVEFPFEIDQIPANGVYEANAGYTNYIEIIDERTNEVWFVNHEIKRVYLASQRLIYPQTIFQQEHLHKD